MKLNKELFHGANVGNKILRKKKKTLKSVKKAEQNQDSCPMAYPGTMRLRACSDERSGE